MKRTALLVIALGIVMIAPMLSSASALTDAQAKTYGPGFHEPGADWYDPTYAHRVKITSLNTVNRDTGFAAASVDFGDYFSTADGIIDLASMQLVKVGANESSIPVTYQASTDALDFWNPPTLPFIEDEIIGAILADNGTAIGTIFNTIDATGYINVSMRFSTLLTSKIDKLKFQIVYDPDNEFAVTDNDYLSIYAGVPGNWSAPVRVYRNQLPDVLAWTDLITIDLPGNGMSGEVWVDFSAPTLYGATSKFFSFDYSFVDGDGFRNVKHYLTGSLGEVTQKNYYPRVQVFEKESPPVVDIYYIAGTGNVSYYLYFNHVAESNHRVIDNVAVTFGGEIDIPQHYFNSFLAHGSVFIDKDGIKNEGSANLTGSSVNTKDIRGNTINTGMTALDLGYDTSSTFGTVFSTATISNATTSVTYTMFKGIDFLDVKITSAIATKMVNRFTDAYSAHPFDNFAYDDGSFLVEPGSDGMTGQSKFAGFFNAANRTYAVIASNKDMNYTVGWDGDLNYTISFPVGSGTTMFVILFGDDGADATATDVRAKGNTTAVLLGNRMVSITQTVSTTSNAFAPIEIHNITDDVFLGMAYIGDPIKIALFGNNLQSMVINIDNKTGNIPITGTYTISAADIAKLNRGLLERYHTFKVTGRNEFGQTATVEFSTWVASDFLDSFWILILMLFQPIFAIFGLAMIGGVSTVLIKTKRNAKKNNCIGDKCNI
jgi:hypothetical protein